MIINLKEKKIVCENVCYKIIHYSKNPHTRTPIFGVQADWVLIYRVF